MWAGKNHSAQLGGFFAVTFLNKSTLKEASLTNAKLRLIKMAGERGKKEPDDENEVMLKHPE